MQVGMRERMRVRVVVVHERHRVAQVGPLDARLLVVGQVGRVTVLVVAVGNRDRRR